MYEYSIMLSWPSKHGSGYGYEIDKIYTVFPLTIKEFLSKLKSEKIKSEIINMLHLCFFKLKEEEFYRNKKLYTNTEDYKCWLTITR